MQSTLYKLLIACEREKQVTQHKLSYHKVTRLADGQVETGSDGFNVEATQEMKFRIIQQNAEAKVVCKNLFSRCTLQSIEESPFIQSLFRFRFERVGQSLKVQKPYVVSKIGISLVKGKPVQLTVHG